MKPFFAMKFRAAACVLGLVACVATHSSKSNSSSWKPASAPLMTRWSKDVSPTNAWPEYPRPTMVREKWLNLNGLWDYTVVPVGSGEPQEFEGQILVPYPIESALSGVARRIESSDELWYRRTFRIPSEWKGERVLLHFGAVDWRARVIVNGRQLGVHEGGYDAFELDVTDALVAGENEVRVAVLDPIDTGGQPRGKQVRKPEGIWYTPSSGIWQTVWLEPVPTSYVKRLEIVPHAKSKNVDVLVEIGGAPASGVSFSVRSDVGASGRNVSSGAAQNEFRATLPLSNPHLWSPDDPFLHELTVSVNGESGVIDRVESYFGLRDTEVGLDEHGVRRLLLNGRPLFQFGPLDQGFWPDGLYTAPTLEAARFDIEAVKRMGGNMLRKHVKVEPELFYAECDRLGMLVWQDMPSGDNSNDEWKQNFATELTALVRGRFNHPSIVMWVPFNEGWGQHDTEAVVKLVHELDPSRPVNNASGWTDKKVGDVIDIHSYPGPSMAPVEAARASVLGEFGGLGLPLEGHTWLAKDSWGYRSFTSRDALTDAYVELLDQLPLLIGQGLSAAVYTQTTDVEIEVNGWLTYDREVWKIDPARAADAAKHLYEPPPSVHVLVANAAQAAPVAWRFTTGAPTANWSEIDFDDSSWSSGVAGFGTQGTPGARVGTTWSTNDIWLRREFELGESDLGATHFSLHHDENVELYLNGVLAAELDGYTTDYVFARIAPQARAALKPGRNVLAIHCKQTGGGQYIDAGLVAIR